MAGREREGRRVGAGSWRRPTAATIRLTLLLCPPPPSRTVNYQTPYMRALQVCVSVQKERETRWGQHQTTLLLTPTLSLSLFQGRAEWPDPLNPPALDATGLGALEVRGGGGQVGRGRGFFYDHKNSTFPFSPRLS